MLTGYDERVEEGISVSLELVGNKTSDGKNASIEDVLTGGGNWAAICFGFGLSSALDPLESLDFGLQILDDLSPFDFLTLGCFIDPLHFGYFLSQFGHFLSISLLLI